MDSIKAMSLNLSAKNNAKKPMLDHKYIDELQDAIRDSIEKMQKLTNNEIISALGEHQAITKLSNLALASAESIVETQVLHLIDVMSVAFDETSGSLKKLRDTNEKLSSESAFIVSSLKDISKRTKEIDDHSQSLEKLNSEMDRLKSHIDNGMLDIAAKCANALK